MTDKIKIRKPLIISALAFLLAGLFPGITLSAPKLITRLEADIWPTPDYSSFPEHLAVFNNKLYFVAENGDGFGRELWVCDGTNPPNQIADIFPVHSSRLSIFSNSII